MPVIFYIYLAFSGFTIILIIKGYILFIQRIKWESHWGKVMNNIIFE